MKRENEFSPDIKLTETDAGAVPTISFASKDAGGLFPEKFDIGGNVFTAWYDAAHRLIFVLDYTGDERTSNVLLVINRDARDASRKWDDILANDYNLDLETIRPKKNNKYQKLDIEYDGLPVYNQLINAIDTSDALSELSEFRNRAALGLANARLAAATEQTRKATETVAETEIAINTAHTQIKSAKEKLSKLKSKIGKEPTKESAAKILRQQAKIEQSNDKLKRAELRLRRAHRRLADAEKDSAAARARLAALEKTPVTINKKIETKVTDMPEEVKPLFTKDPEIMDNTMAFKPIDFGASVPPPPPPSAQPQFTPPPLNLRPVPHADAESFEAQTPYNQPAHTPAPVVPLSQMPPVAPPPQAPNHYDLMASRPQSFSGGDVKITSSSGGRSGPSAMYYFMLVILIALSILTLWMYQKRMTNNIPNILQPVTTAPAPRAEPVEQTERPSWIGGLRATMNRLTSRPATAPQQPAEPAVVQPAPELADADNAFLDDDGFMIPVTLPARIPEDMPENFEMPAPLPEPVFQPEPVFEPADKEPVIEQEWAVQEIETPAFEPQFEEPAITEESPLGYFANAVEEFLEQAAHYEVPEEQDYDIAPFAVEATVEEGPLLMCEDGTQPDMNGCCGGESLTEIPGFGPACCPPDEIDGGDCFPPLG